MNISRLESVLDEEELEEYREVIEKYLLPAESLDSRVFTEEEIGRLIAKVEEAAGDPPGFPLGWYLDMLKNPKDPDHLQGTARMIIETCAAIVGASPEEAII